MQPFPIPYEPAQLSHCQIPRSRKELNTRDTVNARLTEQWNTDAPYLVNNRRRKEDQAAFYDMMPIGTRTYSEDLKQWNTFQTPRPKAAEKRAAEDASKRILAEYAIIQRIDTNIKDLEIGSDAWNSLQLQRQQAQQRASVAQEEYYDSQNVTIATNPYFDKYDVASDPRNVVRELRSAVSEDKVDRGIREARTLLSRQFDSRWLPLEEKEKKGYDTLVAYELMRPSLNVMEMNYRAPRPRDSRKSKDTIS